MTVSGCALYQDTNSVADQLARQFLAGHAEVPVGRGAHAVHDRVVQIAQPGRRHPARPDPDPAEEAHPLVLEHRAQIVLQRLDLLVVRGDAVTHQPVRARQPVQDVDEHLGVLLDQTLGGVDPTRP